MNPLREFLEASNLHGLVHISNAESKWGRVLWTISVFVSFACASILINESFKGWSVKPVSSVISTYPIKDLKFPNVTVCPPKGTNTALNYDLTKLNKTFQPAQREMINNKTMSIFTGSDRNQYVKNLAQVVNSENLRNMYKGYQTMPAHLNQTGFKMELFGSHGEVTIPSIDKYDTILYVIKFPENLGQLVGGTGKLTLEMQIGSEGKGEERVEYREGPFHEYVPYRYKWQEAEDHCVEKGGHLVSPTSGIELGAAYSATNFEAAYDKPVVWLGGKRNEMSHSWNWSSGKDWVYEDWNSEADVSSEDKTCLIGYIQYYTLTDGTWFPSGCQDSYISGFICEYKPDQTITGSQEISFGKDSLPTKPLHILWKHEPSQTFSPKIEQIKKNELKLMWRVVNRFPDLDMKSSQLNGDVETPGFKGKYEEELYQADRRAKFTLQLPATLEKIQENNTLVVNLETVIVEDPRWKESVVYAAGPVFKYHSERKTWEEAEKICVESGSHLAAVKNYD